MCTLEPLLGRGKPWQEGQPGLWEFLIIDHVSFCVSEEEVQILRFPSSRFALPSTTPLVCLDSDMGATHDDTILELPRLIGSLSRLGRPRIAVLRPAISSRSSLPAVPDIHIPYSRQWSSIKIEWDDLRTPPSCTMPRQHLTPNACLVCRRKRTKVSDTPRFYGAPSIPAASRTRQGPGPDVFHFPSTILVDQAPSVTASCHAGDAGLAAKSALTRTRNGGPRTT